MKNILKCSKLQVSLGSPPSYLVSLFGGICSAFTRLSLKSQLSQTDSRDLKFLRRWIWILQFCKVPIRCRRRLAGWWWGIIALELVSGTGNGQPAGSVRAKAPPGSQNPRFTGISVSLLFLYSKYDFKVNATLPGHLSIFLSRKHCNILVREFQHPLETACSNFSPYQVLLCHDITDWNC